MLLDVEVKKWGNSYGLRLTMRVPKRLKVEDGATVNIDIIKKFTELTGFGICKGAPAYEDDPYDDREF